MGTYGTVWALMGLYGLLLNRMGTYERVWVRVRVPIRSHTVFSSTRFLCSLFTYQYYLECPVQSIYGSC